MVGLGESYKRVLVSMRGIVPGKGNDFFDVTDHMEHELVREWIKIAEEKGSKDINTNGTLIIRCYE